MILLIDDISKPLETVIENTTLTILYKSLPLLLKTDGKALKGGDETPRL